MFTFGCVAAAPVASVFFLCLEQEIKAGKNVDINPSL